MEIAFQTAYFVSDSVFTKYSSYMKRIFWFEAKSAKQFFWPIQSVICYLKQFWCDMKRNPLSETIFLCNLKQFYVQFEAILCVISSDFFCDLKWNPLFDAKSTIWNIKFAGFFFGDVRGGPKIDDRFIVIYRVKVKCVKGRQNRWQIMRYHI